jgi:hypothetical protein
LGFWLGAIGLAFLLWLAVAALIVPRVKVPHYPDVEYQFTFSEDGVLVRTASSETRMIWSHFNGFTALRDFYLLRRPLGYLIIPKRAFQSEADKQVFEALLAAHLPNADRAGAAHSNRLKKLVLCGAPACLVLLAIVAGARAFPGQHLDKETAISMTHDVSNSADQMAEMRKHLRPHWVRGEQGGIWLLTGMGEHDDEATKSVFRAMAARIPKVAALDPDEQLAKILDILADDVSAFFASAQLAPGAYQLDNYHLEQATDGKLAFNSYGEPPIELPRERVFSFTVTQEHLKLLRHLHTREFDGFLELIDLKRPYGDMTYYFIDMADALGEPLPPRDAENTPQFTPQQINRYVQLHKEMLFAAQAFWTYAQ